jgi:hypothetical protein
MSLLNDLFGNDAKVGGDHYKNPKAMPSGNYLAEIIEVDLQPYGPTSEAKGIGVTFNIIEEGNFFGKRFTEKFCTKTGAGEPCQFGQNMFNKLCNCVGAGEINSIDDIYEELGKKELYLKVVCRDARDPGKVKENQKSNAEYEQSIKDDEGKVNVVNISGSARADDPKVLAKKANASEVKEDDAMDDIPF